MIDEKVLIGVMLKSREREHGTVASLIDWFIEVINKCPKVCEWIPCSERLPDLKTSVLISTNTSCGQWTGEGCYWETTEHHIIWKGYRWGATYWDDEVVAWMPLPSTYKGE